MAKPKNLNLKPGQHLGTKIKLDKLVRTMEKAIERERQEEKVQRERRT